MKSFLFKMKSTALAGALLMVGGMASAAPVGQPVTIQEGAIAGAVSNTLVVNQLGGFYDEVLTFTSATTFTTEAIFRASGWNVGSQLGFSLPGFNNGYSLYAKFVASGTYSTVGAVTSFSATNNYLELYSDPDMNTVYNIAAAAGAVPSVNNLVLSSSAASITDDRLLGTASLTLASGGTSDLSNIAQGNFEIVFGDFTLTLPDGDAYFIAPRPFHMGLDLNGNFQDITPSVGSSALITNNVANAFFFDNKVPEPGSLALVGVALLGLGASRSIKRAKK